MKTLVLRLNCHLRHELEAEQTMISLKGILKGSPLPQLADCDTSYREVTFQYHRLLAMKQGDPVETKFLMYDFLLLIAEEGYVKDVLESDLSVFISPRPFESQFSGKRQEQI